MNRPSSPSLWRVNLRCDFAPQSMRVETHRLMWVTVLQDAVTEIGACVQCPVDRGLTCLGGQAFEVSEGYWLADDAATCTSGQCILERVYACQAEQACSSGGGARNVTEFTQVAQLHLCAEGHRSDVVLCAR